MNQPILQVALSAGYGARTMLRELRFDLHAGEALGLVGSSGAGKSTLALALMGLSGWRGGWVRGEVWLRGQNLLALSARAARALRGREIALVPQSPLLALNSQVSLQNHFRAAWRAHVAGDSAALDRRLHELLPELNLPESREFLHRRPGAISVGQAQRVLVALALLHRPSVLLADEPTSALDPVNQAQLLRLLSHTTRRTGTALLYISHDLLSVLQLCGRIGVLDAGSLVQETAVHEAGGLQSGVQCDALRALLDALPVDPRHVRSFASAASQEECNFSPPSPATFVF